MRWRRVWKACGSRGFFSSPESGKPDVVAAGNPAAWFLGLARNLTSSVSRFWSVKLRWESPMMSANAEIVAARWRGYP